MPYIKDIDRAIIISGNDPVTVGELNYLITTIIDRYLQRSVSYSNINAVIGVLECAKLELYRRVAAPYEDQKCFENGDVYGCQQIETGVEFPS